MSSAEAWIVSGIILFLLLVILLVILSIKGNKNQDEVLRKQSIVIVELAEEIKALKAKMEECCSNDKKVVKTIVKETKKEEPKPKVVKKVVVEKPKEPSAEEIAKRDAEREKLRLKAEKAAQGKKITAEHLKNMKLTDLWGIGVKREKYFHENGIKDIVALSKKDIEKLPKKLIEGLPALKSWTYEIKREAIKANIAEANFMVNALTNEVK